MMIPKRKVVKSIFLLSVLFTSSVSQAQRYGCPDPAAVNYSSSVTTNDGSCTYNIASVNPVLDATLSTVVNESSGLLYWNGKVWTFNDSGGQPALYVIDSSTGQIKETVTLNNATNIDWEDIAQDDNYIYIGDFGNNASGNRTDLKIYKISKSDVKSKSSVTASVIRFSYSDQTDFTPTSTNTTNFDCEALIAYNDSLFLFSKDWSDNQTRLYKLPKTPGNYTAINTGQLNVQGLITGAEIIPDKRVIVLTGYSNFLSPFLYLLYDFSGNQFFGANKRKVSVDQGFLQMEGITAVNDTSFFISNERFQYLFITSPAKLQSVDLASFLNPYYRSLSGVLAVKGLHLDVRRQTVKQVSLSWYCLTETNGGHYNAERSYDGKDFQTVSTQIPAKEKSTGKTIYALTDTNGYYGTSYYRIRKEDNNGFITYSNIVSVAGMNDGPFSVYPNPASRSCRIELPANYPAASISLTFYAASGAIVYHRDHLNLVGSSWEVNNLSALAPGIYMVVADNGIRKLYDKLKIVR